MAVSVFERKETKYIITSWQHDKLLEALKNRMEPDKFGVTRICNIYFDTDDYRVIRDSIEKPKYKQKLRLRTYGVPQYDSPAFVELKKKLNGIVYKRREIMPYIDAMRLLINREKPEKQTQILREIEWVLDTAEGLGPAMVLCYDRCAYVGVEDPELRMTMDTNITYRIHDFDLSLGSYGDTLMDSSRYVLELKTNGAMPLWLAEAFDRLFIYPGSYTKYGNAYKKMLMEGELI